MGRNLYCMYLRKSRADLEAEARGEGETLSRHRRTLTELAARMKLPIGEIYEEIVSGESLALRPEVQRMLSAIEGEMWAGVLCMDVDRLARGDSIDQGIISQAFLYSGTTIITPGKIYDPRNESDSEFFEMKMFFSRREYTQIRKRLQEGRRRSVLDGRYMGTRAVYGYERTKIPNDKGWTLTPVPEKAQVVRMIFEWYAFGLDGDIVGFGKIAKRLNDMGLLTDLGNKFSKSSVFNIVTNPTYIGMVRWNQRVTTVRMRDGQRVKTRPKSDNPILARGLHEPIISQELFDAAQERYKGRYVPRVNENLAIANPFAGLTFCPLCGWNMQRKPSYDAARGDLLFCPTPYCETSGIYIELFEQAVIEHLREWLVMYAPENTPPEPVETTDPAKVAIVQLEQQLATAQTQLSRLYDLLEQGLYTTDVFLSRQRDLTARVSNIEDQISVLRDKPHGRNQADVIRSILPAVQNAVDSYSLSMSAGEKNVLLKTVISKIEYGKTAHCYRNQNPLEYLTMTIYPRIPV